MNKGLVLKINGGNYTIKDLDTNEIITAKASGKLRYVRVASDKIITVSPKAGDIVNYDNNYIESVNERKNSLRRPDCANIDQVVLIFSCKEPDFSFNLLDNFILHIEKENIDIKIVITKIDLLTNDELIDLKKKLSYYESIGYEVYYTSSKKSDGIDNLKPLFENKISVLSGQTGAGKSSLLNAIDPAFNQNTNEISKALGRGKHTTRTTELLEYDNGYIADTPGFSSLDFFGFEIEDLKKCFKDFYKLSNECRYSDCNHINEPDCAVKNNLDKILKSRYENYLKFYEEIKKNKKY